MQPKGAEPLHPSPLPELPFQKVGTDLFEWDKKVYLLVIDYYSCFIEIAQLTGSSSAEVVRHTKSIFAIHGILEVVVSDNGPQYTSSTFAELHENTGSVTSLAVLCTPKGMERQSEG